MTPLPSVDWEMFGDEVLADPYPYYKKMRDLGPVVHLAADDLLAVTRYADVKKTLHDWASFSSAQGVAFTPARNDVMRGQSLLSTDPPEHKALRDNIMRWLSTKRVRAYQERIEAHADEVVDALVRRGSFDAVTDFAEVLPATVVGQLVGLPQEIRAELITWGDATFNSAGPDNTRTRSAIAIVDHLNKVLPTVQKGDVDPGSTAFEILTMVENGELSQQDAVRALVNLSGASLDTTISGLATAVHQLALAPEQWDAIRDDPSLATRACEEALRFEPPAQVFSRVATMDCEIDGAPIAAGQRVAVYFGAANRDERHYKDPDRFDLMRDARDQLSFGYGIHHCAGATLARIEIVAGLVALTQRIRRLDVGVPARRPNNITRRLSSLPVTIAA